MTPAPGARTGAAETRTADGHASGLLPPVLQGEQLEIGQLGDRLARCAHTEDARLLQIRLVEIVPIGHGHPPMIWPEIGFSG